MPPVSPSRPSLLDTVMARFVAVERKDVAALLASFAMFFTLLAAYYIIRPVRDEMGVRLGKDALQGLFTTVFFVMLAVVPVFGWVASKFQRRYVLPGIYLFFVFDLVAFWMVFRADASNAEITKAFFVWASVFNLFVISLFWSLMAELWSNEESKRLYGFISAGGTAGALAGPLLTQELVSILSPIDLLLVSAALLVVAMMASLRLRALRPGEGMPSTAAGGGILDGAVKLASSPYLARIALFVFLANLVGTFFYLEQSRLVGAAIADSAERVRFFSGRDLLVSLATITIEIFGTAEVLRRFGVTGALLALPAIALAGTLALSFDPSLWIAGAVMVAERVTAFALSSPAIKVMYTLTSADEKYKVQNFIDTVVYRGGDAVSGGVFKAVAGDLGFAAPATPLIAVPLCLAWFWTARNMGKSHAERAARSTPA